LEPVDYDKLSILAPCLLTLSTKYFKTKRASQGSLVVINLVPNPRSFLQRKMLYSINEDIWHNFGVMVKDGRLKHLNASAWGVTDKAQSYLLLMVVMDDLDVTLKQWKGLPTWNPLAQTVIVFMDPMENIATKNLLVRETFENLLNEGILKAIVMYQMKDENMRMISESWYPYYNKSCAKKVENIHEIDECIVGESFNETSQEMEPYENITALNEYLEPKMPSTFHGCPIHVSVRESN
jgi:hypothetical protein